MVDPDCRAGKHGSCVGGPCECGCHAETEERMAYLFGCMFNLAERGNKEAQRMLSEYREHFEPPCRGVLAIKGEMFRCELSAGHEGGNYEGLAHSNRAAEAIWGDSDLTREEG